MMEAAFIVLRMSSRSAIGSESPLRDSTRVVSRGVLAVNLAYESIEQHIGRYRYWSLGAWVVAALTVVRYYFVLACISRIVRDRGSPRYWGSVM